MPHAIVVTLNERPDVLVAVRDAIRAQVPSDVVVVVDEILVNNRVTTDQSYVNANAAYVYLNHGGQYLTSDQQRAVGENVTSQFKGFEVVFVFNDTGPWFADGKAV